MNLRDLRYLVAVADHRHFGKAAAACFVSQPTLSAQIKKLERELGVELIERNPRQIMVTATGVRVVEHARAMLREADTIEQIAQRSQDPEGGSIRMGLIPTVAPYLLPHVVPDLHRRFPNLELLLAEEKTDVSLDLLRRGLLDVAVLALPVPDDQLDSALLFSEDFVLAVPSDHPLAASDEPVDISVLAHEPVLLLEEGHCLRDQALDVCRLVGADERDGFRATSLETLRQMVAAGVAVTLLPELAVLPPVPDSFDICLRRFAEPAPRRDIAMFWRRSSVNGELYRKVAGVLRDVMAA
jgi:LysR family hydrogen peroxide-inducible transcriptional activator